MLDLCVIDMLKLAVSISPTIFQLRHVTLRFQIASEVLGTVFFAIASIRGMPWSGSQPVLYATKHGPDSFQDDEEF